MSDEIVALSEALARDPQSLVFLELGEALRARGQAEAARKVALKGLERHPHLAEAHDLLARLYADAGDLERAFDEWDMARRLSPTHAGALKGLGYVRFRQGRLDEAEGFLAAAADADPSDAENLGALAWVRQQRAGTADVAASADAHQAPPVSAVPMSPAAVDPMHLFRDVVGDGGLALLIGRDGLLLAGEGMTREGRDVGQDVGAAMSGVGDEATRAMRHLGLGAWQAIIFETDRATVAMSPAPTEALLLVAAPRTTPLGLVRRLLDRAAQTATRFLEGA